MIGRRLSPELRLKAGAHIKQIAAELGVRVHFNESYASDPYGDPHGAYDNTSRRITGPPVRSALDYFVHLHELGHVDDLYELHSMASETRAWTFATAWADPAIMATMTETAWDAVGRFFTSYIRHEVNNG